MADVVEHNNVYWNKLSAEVRKHLIWGIWMAAWLLLLVGLFNRSFYHYVCLLALAQLLIFLGLFQFQWKTFPVQVRIGYLIWVCVGTYVPYMTILMYITTIGLATNLFAGYCPLARMLSLLPLNRNKPLTWDLIKRTFTAPPSKGAFKLS